MGNDRKMLLIEYMCILLDCLHVIMLLTSKLCTTYLLKFNILSYSAFLLFIPYTFLLNEIRDKGSVRTVIQNVRANIGFHLTQLLITWPCLCLALLGVKSSWLIALYHDLTDLRSSRELD